MIIGIQFHGLPVEERHTTPFADFAVAFRRVIGRGCFAHHILPKKLPRHQRDSGARVRYWAMKPVKYSVIVPAAGVAACVAMVTITSVSTVLTNRNPVAANVHDAMAA